MRAIERQKTQPPEQPVTAHKAPRDDEGEGPEDQHHADIEFKAQRRPWGRQADDAAFLLRICPAHAQPLHRAAIDIGKGIPAFEPVKPLAAFKGELQLGQRVDNIMARKAPDDAVKAPIIKGGDRLFIDERADQKAGEINGHSGSIGPRPGHFKCAANRPPRHPPVIASNAKQSSFHPGLAGLPRRTRLAMTAKGGAGAMHLGPFPVTLNLFQGPLRLKDRCGLLA